MKIPYGFAFALILTFAIATGFSSEAQSQSLQDAFTNAFKKFEEGLKEGVKPNQDQNSAPPGASTPAETSPSTMPKIVVTDATYKKISTTQLNVRSEPSRTGQKIGTLMEGETVSVIGEVLRW